MAFDLIHVKEHVRYLPDLVAQRLLVGAALLCLEPDFVDSLAELQECLVFDPARVVGHAPLQELQTANQLVSFCILNKRHYLRQQFDGDATDSPDRVCSKLRESGQHLGLEFRVVNVLGDGEQCRHHLLFDFEKGAISEGVEAL